MRAHAVEHRCPTCGSGDLLEPFGAFERPLPEDGSGYLCLACEVEFTQQPVPAR